MIKKIITNRALLQEPCAPIDVGRINAESGVIRDLIMTAKYNHGTRESGCIGLAAPQIGHKVRIFVLLENDDFLVMINPEILKKAGGIQYVRENCYSCPGRIVKKGRYKRIQVQYLDKHGLQITRYFNKLNARVYQHELDLLNGITI